MSITLAFRHIDGLVLQQQTLYKDKDSQTWKNDPEAVKQDEDPRRRDERGLPTKLGTYHMHLTANLKNLVISNKGPVTHVDFRNSSLRNQLRIKTQVLTDVKGRKEWKDSGTPVFVPANAFGGAFVGTGQRAILDEMPT